MQLLDPDWLAAAAAALADLPESEGASAVVDYVVSGAPQGKLTIGVVVDNGRVTTVAQRKSAAPDIVVSAGYDVVSSILRGRISADVAYMNGTLKVDGAHARWMLDLRPVRRAAVEALAPLMGDTES